MGVRRKKTGFFLKLLVVMLVVYAAVQMAVLQIGVNAQRDSQAQLAEQRDELARKVEALRSYNSSIESGLDLQTIAQIARDHGWFFKDEIIIVDKGH